MVTHTKYFRLKTLKVQRDFFKVNLVLGLRIIYIRKPVHFFQFSKNTVFFGIMTSCTNYTNNATNGGEVKNLEKSHMLMGHTRKGANKRFRNIQRKTTV